MREEEEMSMMSGTFVVDKFGNNIILFAHCICGNSIRCESPMPDNRFEVACNQCGTELTIKIKDSKKRACNQKEDSVE
jgi:hypothetical protein